MESQIIRVGADHQGGIPFNGISVVTTCYNERENLMRLIPAIRSVLANIQHEIIVVDDHSTDDTMNVARTLADRAVSTQRKEQSERLAIGMKLARYDAVVTIDADLENNPRHIPELVTKLNNFDLIVASRPKLPRLSEKLFSLAYSKRLGIRDILSNYRAYRKTILNSILSAKGDTLGAGFIIEAKNKGLRICELEVEAEPRRSDPRTGNLLTANVRILAALLRTFF